MLHVGWIPSATSPYDVVHGILCKMSHNMVSLHIVDGLMIDCSMCAFQCLEEVYQNRVCWNVLEGILQLMSSCKEDRSIPDNCKCTPYEGPQKTAGSKEQIPECTARYSVKLMKDPVISKHQFYTSKESTQWALVVLNGPSWGALYTSSIDLATPPHPHTHTHTHTKKKNKKNISQSYWPTYKSPEHMDRNRGSCNGSWPGQQVEAAHCDHHGSQPQREA